MYIILNILHCVHSVLDNQSVCSYPGETLLFFILSISLWPQDIVQCRGFLSFLPSLLACLLVSSSSFKSSWATILVRLGGVTSGISGRHHLTTQSLLLAILVQWSLSLPCRMCEANVFPGPGPITLHFDLCNGLLPLQQEAS